MRYYSNNYFAIFLILIFHGCGSPNIPIGKNAKMKSEILKDNEQFIFLSRISLNDCYEDYLYITKEKDSSKVLFYRECNRFESKKEEVFETFSISFNSFHNTQNCLQDYSEILCDNKIQNIEPKSGHNRFVLVTNDKYKKTTYEWNFWALNEDILLFPFNNKQDTFLNHTNYIANCLSSTLKDIKYLKPKIITKELSKSADSTTIEIFLSTEEKYIPNYYIRQLNSVYVNGFKVEVFKNTFGRYKLANTIDINSLEIVISATNIDGSEDFFYR